jgi:hypothetical protein
VGSQRSARAPPLVSRAACHARRQGGQLRLCGLPARRCWCKKCWNFFLKIFEIFSKKLKMLVKTFLKNIGFNVFSEQILTQIFRDDYENTSRCANVHSPRHHLYTHFQRSNTILDFSLVPNFPFL